MACPLRVAYYIHTVGPKARTRLRTALTSVNHLISSRESMLKMTQLSLQLRCPSGLSYRRGPSLKAVQVYIWRISQQVQYWLPGVYALIVLGNGKGPLKKLRRDFDDFDSDESIISERQQKMPISESRMKICNGKLSLQRSSFSTTLLRLRQRWGRPH